jgi:hypothetical protein
LTEIVEVVEPLDQEKVPPVGFTVGVNVVENPLQIFVVVGKLTVGTGLTVTIEAPGKLGHPLSV